MRTMLIADSGLGGVGTTRRAALSDTAIAQLAVRALREEAELTPKPGLVDRRGGGSHADMDLRMLCNSADSLESMFAAMATAAHDEIPSAGLQAQLAAIGRAGEERMLRVTGGVNTHRGAIWNLGLLVASVAMGPGSADGWCARAGELARFHEEVPGEGKSHGREVERRFGRRGARGEACGGFRHVIQFGLPELRRARAKMTAETHARLDALLAIIGELDDTCILYRGGEAALQFAKTAAQNVRSLGGAASDAGHGELLNLGVEMVRRGISPGGSADLLAATLFLDSAETHGA